jgi:hypothetical protein
MRHDKFPHVTPHAPTPAKLRAAQRALHRECAARPLLAPQIQAAQPSPPQRLQQIHDAHARHWTALRAYQAQLWRKCRRALNAAQAPGDALRQTWNTGTCPASPEYLADLIRAAGLQFPPN